MCHELQVCYDIFTPHSGSTNLSSSPRLAVNHKWGVVDKAGVGFYNVTTGSSGRLGDRADVEKDKQARRIHLRNKSRGL
jgi:hypothetical protein